jgi:hypothetical protein
MAVMLVRYNCHTGIFWFGSELENCFDGSCSSRFGRGQR